MDRINIIHAYFDDFNSQNIDQLITYFHSEFEYHPPSYVNRMMGKDRFVGKNNFSELAEQQLEMAPEMEFHINEVFNNDDDGFIVLGDTKIGEIGGNIFGIKDISIDYDFVSIIIFRFKGEKISSMTWIYDTLDLFLNVGAVVFARDDPEMINHYIRKIRTASLDR